MNRLPRAGEDDPETKDRGDDGLDEPEWLDSASVSVVAGLVGADPEVDEEPLDWSRFRREGRARPLGIDELPWPPSSAMVVKADWTKAALASTSRFKVVTECIESRL